MSQSSPRTSGSKPVFFVEAGAQKFVRHSEGANFADFKQCYEELEAAEAETAEAVSRFKQAENHLDGMQKSFDSRGDLQIEIEQRRAEAEAQPEDKRKEAALTNILRLAQTETTKLNERKEAYLAAVLQALATRKTLHNAVIAMQQMLFRISGVQRSGAWLASYNAWQLEALNLNMLCSSELLRRSLETLSVKLSQVPSIESLGIVVSAEKVERCLAWIESLPILPHVPMKEEEPHDIAHVVKMNLLLQCLAAIAGSQDGRSGVVDLPPGILHQDLAYVIAQLEEKGWQVKVTAKNLTLSRPTETKK